MSDALTTRECPGGIASCSVSIMAPLFCVTLVCILRNKKRPVVFFPEASTWLPSQSLGRVCSPGCVCSPRDWLEHVLDLGAQTCLGLHVQIPLRAVLAEAL